MDSDYFSTSAHEQLCCAFGAEKNLFYKWNFSIQNSEKTDDRGRYELRFNIGVREAIGIHGSEMGTADDANH